MAKKPLPSPEVLRQLLRYEPETGKLFWKITLSNRKPKGTEAFAGRGSHGYRHGGIYGGKYLAHRVIWAMEHGAWPKFTVDHVNGNKEDNRLCNLREATWSENNCNTGPRRRNKTGMKGVCFDTRKGKFLAQVAIQRRNYHIGYFNTAESAHAAYCIKASSLHGKFYRAE